MTQYMNITYMVLLVFTAAAFSNSKAALPPEEQIAMLTSQNAALIERVEELDEAIANYQGFTSESALADAIIALPDAERLTVRRFMLNLIPAIPNGDTALTILIAVFNGKVRDQPHMSDPDICQAVYTLWNDDPRFNIRNRALSLLLSMNECPISWHDVLITKIEDGEWENLLLAARWNLSTLRPMLARMLDSIPEQREVSSHAYFFLSDADKEKNIHESMSSRVAVKDLARACLARWGDSSQMNFLLDSFDRAPPNKAVPQLTHKDKAYWAALLAVADNIPKDLPPIPPNE
jgi:hypothetical protein